MPDNTDDIKEALTRKREIVIPPTDLLSSGSTLFDLACSGTIDGAYAKGTYNLAVGESQSGKTLLSYNTLAEASINPAYDDYRLIYDGPEFRDFFNIAHLWPRLADRLEPPRKDKNGNPEYSVTIEDFYFNLDNAIKDGRPFIWIEDSIASLSSEDEQERMEKDKALHEKGKELSGSYGDGKAKKNSQYLRQMIPGINKSGSILNIINQVRDNIGFGAQFNPKVYSGGRALKHYATLEIWFSVVERLKTEHKVRGKNRQIGTLCQVKIKKNSINGRERTIELPIYPDVGVDDLGSCVDFLVEERHWIKEGGKIQAIEFEFIGDREALIHQIEENREERDLKQVVKGVWDEIEGECRVHRKPRYT